MGKVKVKRKFVDWDSIEPLYRAGVLPLSGICRQYAVDHANSQVWKTQVTHGAICQKVKQKKWTKNLADKVKKRIQEKLLTGRLTGNDKKLSDTEIVEKAADVGSNVVLRHRKEIVVLEEYETDLLADLKASEGDSLKDRTIILKNITDTRAKRIALERQAYSLGGSGDDEDPLKGLPDDQINSRIEILEAKLKK